MAVDIQAFRQSALQPKNRTVHLSQGEHLRIGKLSKFGRLVSWVKGFRSSQNQAVRQQFLESLKTHYGAEISSAVSARLELAFPETQKRPLTSFMIREALGHANTYRANLSASKELAARYPLEEIKNKIIEASQGGKHRVTLDEAADIAGKYFETRTDTGYTSDEVLTELRNLGVPVSAPRRIGQAGGAQFSKEAIKYISKDLSHGTPDARQKDGVAGQMLADVARSHYFLDDKEFHRASAKEWIPAFKDFCKDSSGRVNENMVFGLSQMAHQGMFAPLMKCFTFNHLAPFRDQPMWHNGEASTFYSFTKDESGSVFLTMEHQVKNLKACIASNDETVHGTRVLAFSGDSIPLNGDNSYAKLSLTVRFDPTSFTDDRTKFVVPEVQEATYEYSFDTDSSDGGDYGESYSSDSYEE